jgi:hypothetical protein
MTSRTQNWTERKARRDRKTAERDRRNARRVVAAQKAAAQTAIREEVEA